MLPVLSDPACCTPISEAPLAPADAADLAGAFKALGDPVRLQLMSMIASHAGGEVCVCDLTPAFDAVRADDLAPSADPARGRTDRGRPARHLDLLPPGPGPTHRAVAAARHPGTRDGLGAFTDCS